MTDPTETFFDDLGRRDHEPLLAHKKGTIRVELADNGHTERWTVTFDDGDINVSHKKGAADSTIRADKSVFDRIVRGDTNAMAALLRGAVSVDGDWNLLVLFQRLFPSPTGAPETAAEGRRS
jgi:putative sterol carrier protein